MKYFSVEKEELVGTLVAGEVYSDGEYRDLPSDTDPQETVTGFTVTIYDEGGMIEECRFYPVSINTRSWATNEDEVLDSIKENYSADKGYQNNNW